MWSSKALHFLINVARIYQQKVISIIWNNNTVLLQYLKLADFSRYFLISLKITIQCFLQYRTVYYFLELALPNWKLRDTKTTESLWLTYTAQKPKLWFGEMNTDFSHLWDSEDKTTTLAGDDEQRMSSINFTR